MTDLKWRTRNVIMSGAALLCRVLGPRFAAWLTAKSIRHIPGASGVNFLVLARPSFSKDVEALAKYTDLGFIIVQRGFVRFQQVFLPRDRREQTFYQNAMKPFSGVRDPQAIYSEELLKYANRYAPISGILSANFDYWQDVGLKFQSRAQNLVFGVICRENAVVPIAVSLNTERYKEASYRFEGDFIVTAGQTSANMMIDCGVADPERILPIGLPRYDIWQETGKRDKRFITLLTFTHGYRADSTFRSVLEVFADHAHAAIDSDITYLIKTKDADDSRILHQLLKGRLTSNLRIDHEIPMNDALASSYAIVGYNSLSLIDALLSGAQIILPAWGECLTEGETCMFPITSESVCFFCYADSKGALMTALDMAKNQSKPKEVGPQIDLVEYIQRYVTYNPGQLNSAAFAAVALDYVAQKGRQDCDLGLD